MQLRLHISLDVTDLEAAVNFYGAVFAFLPTKRYDDYLICGGPACSG